MKRVVGPLAIAAVAVAGCEDITNPVEEFGSLVDPFVQFVQPSTIGTPGSYNRVIIQMPTRLEEDVTVQYTFGGDAVFGTDYVIVNADSTVRTDVTAAGGTASIRYDAGEDLLPRDTIIVFVPFDATDGRTLEIEIVSAEAESGRNVETGYIDDYRSFSLNVEGFVNVPVGVYASARTGDFGNGTGTVTISTPAQPIVVDGVPYNQRLSDYQGDAGVFGIPVPWAFSVTSGGTVLAAPMDAAGYEVTSDVTGTFDFDSSTLALDIVLTCCGAAGFGWSMEATQ
ncbi:MAG: hypothetical protein WEF86_12565 [Gemmatimonadota bacterium]